MFKYSQPAASGTEAILAGVSWVAAPVVLFSEFTLKSTGCGLPAGPFGLYGALEGVSYLWVVGLVAYSIYVKVMTGKVRRCYGCVYQSDSSFGT
jgi:hypothetical protein